MTIEEKITAQIADAIVFVTSIMGFEPENAENERLWDNHDPTPLVLLEWDYADDPQTGEPSMLIAGDYTKEKERELIIYGATHGIALTLPNSPAYEAEMAEWSKANGHQSAEFDREIEKLRALRGLCNPEAE